MKSSDQQADDFLLPTGRPSARPRQLPSIQLAFFLPASRWLEQKNSSSNAQLAQPADKWASRELVSVRFGAQIRPPEHRQSTGAEQQTSKQADSERRVASSRQSSECVLVFGRRPQQAPNGAHNAHCSPRAMAARDLLCPNEQPLGLSRPMNATPAEWRPPEVGRPRPRRWASLATGDCLRETVCGGAPLGAHLYTIFELFCGKISPKFCKFLQNFAKLQPASVCGFSVVLLAALPAFLWPPLCLSAFQLVLIGGEHSTFGPLFSPDLSTILRPSSLANVRLFSVGLVFALDAPPFGLAKVGGKSRPDEQKCFVLLSGRPPSQRAAPREGQHLGLHFGQAESIWGASLELVLQASQWALL